MYIFKTFYKFKFSFLTKFYYLVIFINICSVLLQNFFTEFLFLKQIDLDVHLPDVKEDLSPPLHQANIKQNSNFQVEFLVNKHFK